MVVVRLLPAVVGVGDVFDVGGGEVALGAVFQVAHCAGVDKEGLAFLRFGFVQYPDAGGDLGVGEELAGQGDHGFYEVGLDEGAADVAFAAALAAHGAVGEQQCHAPCGGEVVEHVLQPGVVGVACGRGAVLPARVAGECFAPPVGGVEWGVGHHEVHFLVEVLGGGEGVGVAFAEVVFEAVDGHVHGGEFPGGAVFFLAVDGDVACVALVGADEAFGLDEEAAAAHGGVVYAALVGFEQGDDEGDDGFGGEVLAAAFAFGQGEAAEEVFVDVAEDVFGGECAVALEGVLAEKLDEADEGVAAHAVAADAFEHAFEAGVVFFYGVKGVVDECGHAVEAAAPGQFRAVFEEGGGGDFVPAGGTGHPEDVVLGVVVALFEFGFKGGLVVLRAVVQRGVEIEGVFGVLQIGKDFALLGGEGVGDVFEENQAEDDVFVVGGVQLGAELVGGFPEGVFEAVEEGLRFSG